MDYPQKRVQKFVPARGKPSINRVISGLNIFLENAFEFDVDALCDGKDVFISGIMQHIEEAGIHSGDSSCVFPPFELSPRSKKTIENYTKKMALTLNTVGLINIQFAVKNEIIYVIEVNPRASRTVPFISKVIDIPLAKFAAQIGAGEKIKNLNLKNFETCLKEIKRNILDIDSIIRLLQRKI